MNDETERQTEAKARWGETSAYREFETRAAAKSKEAFSAAGEKLMAVLAGFGELKALPVDDPAVRRQVSRLQNCITENFYACTPEILEGLGRLYSADERFGKTIDDAGGEGTAQFISAAVAAYRKGEKMEKILR